MKKLCYRIFKEINNCNLKEKSMAKMTVVYTVIKI
jgi:hypothetical protein